MKKKLYTIILAVLVVCFSVCLLSGCSAKNKNILTTNGSGEFAYDSLSDLQKDFSLDYSDSISTASEVFTLSSTTATDGSKSDYVLKIDTSSSGYALLSQKVDLTVGCYYSITYAINLTSISTYTSGTAYDGVFVTILEDEDFNYDDNSVYQNSTGSGTYSVSFRAGQTGEATIALCVGTEDHPVKATVNVTEFSLERISYSASKENGDYWGTYKTDYYGNSSLYNIIYIVLGGLAVIGLSIVGYTMFRRHLALTSVENEMLGKGYKNKFLLQMSSSKGLDAVLIIVIGLLVGIVTNLLSTVIASGYTYTAMGYNLSGLASQAVFISKYGPQYLISSIGGDFATDSGYTVMSVSSSPLQLYFLGFAGLFGRIFQKGDQYLATMFFLRLLCTLADIGTALLIFKLVSKKSGNIAGFLAGALYTVLPVVFATSALWGYMVSITVFLITLTFYFMLENKYVLTALVYLVACLFSQVALFVAPMILCYTVMMCMKDIKKVIPASIILVLGFVLFYALSVPFDINFIRDGNTFYCFEQAWAELYKNALYTLNAFNFQAILGNNFGTITTASLVVTIIFILFMLTLVVIDYFKFKNRMNLMLLATAFINMMFVFANNMAPTSMFISLALMLVYAIMNKEKRIFFSFVVFSVLSFVNIAYCELLVDYTTSSVGVWEDGSIPMYIFSALEMVFALYYIYIVYDIVVSRKIRKIQPLNLKVGDAVRNSFLRMKKNYYKLRMKSSH